MIDKQWIIDQFDFTVANGGLEGVRLADARQNVVTAIVDEITSGRMSISDIPLDQVGGMLFDSTVKPVRNQRKLELKNAGAWIVDVINRDTILGEFDPILDRAYSLGKKDGTDKTLRFWTVDDWQGAVTERYRNAADVTSSAQDFDLNVASPIIEALRASNVVMTGDLVMNTVGAPA